MANFDGRPVEPQVTSASPKKRGLITGTLKNVMWMLAGGGITGVLKIFVLLVLARLLVPEEFGVVSAALTIVVLSETLGRVGVAPYIVQMKDLTPQHVATGLTTTVVLGFLIAGLVFAFSGPLSNLYRMPAAQPLLEAFSVLFVINAIGLVSEALLQRALRFRELAVIQFLSYVLGYAAVGVTLAALGYGVWALVFAQIAQAVLQTMMSAAMARNGLSIGFNWSIFVKMLRFGFGITLARIGNYFSQNIDYFIVGRFLGAEALGLYSRAYLLLKHGSDLLGKAGDQVLFATMSSIQDETKRLERALNLALSLTAMVQVPAAALLVVTGPELIVALLGQNWEAAALPFQILISVMVFRTGYRLVNSTLRASGRVYVAAIWQWTFAFAVGCGATFGYQYGLPGVAAGVSVAVVLCHLTGLYILYRLLSLRSGTCLKRLLAYIMYSAGIVVALVYAKQALVSGGYGDFAILLTLFGGFCTLYLGVFFSLPWVFGAEGAVLRERGLRILRHVMRTAKQRDKTDGV